MVRYSRQPPRNGAGHAGDRYLEKEIRLSGGILFGRPGGRTAFVRSPGFEAMGDTPVRFPDFLHAIAGWLAVGAVPLEIGFPPPSERKGGTTGAYAGGNSRESSRVRFRRADP